MTVVTSRADFEKLMDLRMVEARLLLRVCEKIDRRRLMIARYPPIVVKADLALETPEWQPTPGKRQNTTVFKGSNRLQATYDHEIHCQFY